LQKRLTEFVGLSKKEEKLLYDNFKLTGFVPELDTFGSSSEDRKKDVFLDS
jgi:hypothetical protein